MARMSTLKTLLVQAQLGWKDPDRNRAHLAELLAAADGPFDLAVLPETFATGFLGDSGLADESMDGPTVDWMRERCREHDCALAGSVVITEGGQRFNRMLLVTPEGVLAHYDKRHLFSYGGEDRRYSAGRERVTVRLGDWRINLQVCYDLRFPAWCRNRGDYDLQLLVANWPRKRIAHWSALLRARAIENQSWVVAVNRVGEDGNGIVYPGQSVVHDPMGETVVALDDEEVCRRVELDLAAVARTRETFPFQNDADDFLLRP
jgi:predicted amidohydrolase